MTEPNPNELINACEADDVHEIHAQAKAIAEAIKADEKETPKFDAYGIRLILETLADYTNY